MGVIQTNVLAPGITKYSHSPLGMYSIQELEWYDKITKVRIIDRTKEMQVNGESSKRRRCKIEWLNYYDNISNVISWRELTKLTEIMR